jgi:hypothetical protein
MRLVWHAEQMEEKRNEDWIHLTLDTDQYQALVNIIMNLWVP